MLVIELIEKLIKLPQDVEVVLQKDYEGNGYHKAYCTELAYDDEDNNYPSVNNKEELEDIYGVDGDVPAKKVVVIV